jgi:hypothetical protein
VIFRLAQMSGYWISGPSQLPTDDFSVNGFLSAVKLAETLFCY